MREAYWYSTHAASGPGGQERGNSGEERLCHGISRGGSAGRAARTSAHSASTRRRASSRGTVSAGPAWAAQPPSAQDSATAAARRPARVIRSEPLELREVVVVVAGEHADDRVQRLRPALRVHGLAREVLRVQAAEEREVPAPR